MKVLKIIFILVSLGYLFSCNSSIIRSNSPEDLKDAKLVIDSFHNSMQNKNLDFNYFLHQKFYIDKDKNQVDSSTYKLYNEFGIFIEDSIISYNIVTYSNDHSKDEYSIIIKSSFSVDTIYEEFYILNDKNKLRIAGIEIKVK